MSKENPPSSQLQPIALQTLWPASPSLHLIDNRRDEETLASHLNLLLTRADELCIHVAYLRASGVALLRVELLQFLARGGRLRVLAGGDFAQTEPDALELFRRQGKPTLLSQRPLLVGVHLATWYR